MERIPVNTPENIRSEEKVNEIVNTAIQEVIDNFGTEMTPRDKHMLESVIAEASTNPIGRVVYLQQTTTAAGVSENLKDYVNQALQTLREKLTREEQDKFANFGGNLLNNLN